MLILPLSSHFVHAIFCLCERTAYVFVHLYKLVSKSTNQSRYQCSSGCYHINVVMSLTKQNIFNRTARYKIENAWVSIWMCERELLTKSFAPYFCLHSPIKCRIFFLLSTPKYLSHRDRKGIVNPCMYIRPIYTHTRIYYYYIRYNVNAL